MKQFPTRADIGMMGEQNQSPTGLSYGKAQMFEWCAPQQQYLDLTDGGRNNMLSIHPLIPLLLYSDRHFPSPSSPSVSQPMGESDVLQTNSGTHSCYHSNGSGSRSTVQVKKPLNAFMLYMKEMRHKVLQEGRERESAAINRILGRRWHALSHSEQSKYYDLAQKERLLHMQLYPGWSAKDNYGKRKRKRSHQVSVDCSSCSLTVG